MTSIPEATLSLVVSHFQIEDRKSTRLNSNHVKISYAVFCLKKKKNAGPGGERLQNKELRNRQRHGLILPRARVTFRIHPQRPALQHLGGIVFLGQRGGLAGSTLLPDMTLFG